MSMLKKYGIVAMVLVVNSAFSLEVCHSFPGVLRCGKGMIDQLPDVKYGYLNLSGTTVNKLLKVDAGTFHGSHAHLNDVDVSSGSVTLKESSIEGSSIRIASGNVNFTHTDIHHDATILSPHITVDGSHTHSITVPSSDNGKNIRVVLQNNSVVDGNLTVGGTGAEVCVGIGSKITGKVVGATLTHTC